MTKTLTSGRSLSLSARILLHSGIQFAGKGVAALGALALVSVLTRYLGLTNFGRYSFVIAYVSLFYVLIDLGSQAIAVREIAREPQRASEVASHLLALKMLLAFVGVIAANTGALVFPSFAGLRLGVFLASLALLAAPLSATAGALYQTRLQMTLPSLSDVLSRVASLLLVAMIALRSISHGLDLALLAGSIGSWLGALFVFSSASRIARIRPALDRAVAWPMIRDAIPLAIVSVLGIIHYRLDVFVLSAISTMDTIGLYSVATKVLDVSMSGSAIFIGLVFPVLSRRVADHGLLHRAFDRAFDLILVLGVGAAVFGSALAPIVVAVLAGPHFSRAVLPVAIIVWAIPITFANLLFAHMLIAANQQARAVPVTLTAIAFNLMLNFALIPHFGAVAPAAVTVITEGISALGVGIVMARTFGFGPRFSTIARVALAGAVAAFLLAVLQTVSIVLAVPVAALAYTASLTLSGVVRPDDLFRLLRGEAAGI